MTNEVLQQWLQWNEPKRFASVLFQVSPSPLPTQEYSLQLPVQKKKKSQQCDQKIFRGEEEERGSVRQGGYKWRPEAERFEAVDLARLKITK